MSGPAAVADVADADWWADEFGEDLALEVGDGQGVPRVGSAADDQDLFKGIGDAEFVDDPVDSDGAAACDGANSCVRVQVLGNGGSRAHCRLGGFEDRPV